MKISKCLFLVLICLSSCKGQDIYDCDSLGKVNYTPPSVSYEIAGYHNIAIYYEILALNKQILPCLIDSIDTQGTSLIGFINPIFSRIENWFINQDGINYAYYIDYILSKDSIETVKKTWNNDDSLHWEELSRPYRIYNLGIIFKQDEYNQPILEPLTHEDMVKIKKMYLDWWKRNKDKPIETLRKEFRNGNKIFQPPYVWL